MMQSRLITHSLTFLAIMLTQLSSIHAQGIDIMGKVYDSASRGMLIGSRVELLRAADSTVVAQTLASVTNVEYGDTTYVSAFAVETPDDKSDYILRVEDDNHEPTYIPLPATRLKEGLLDLGNIYLRRSVHQLSEVSVTASKVKFYYRGDTIVYNADAFVLAEGSMLDALIRQLPGAELRSDGQIFVNGKFIDNLLLNGKDFFKGNNKVLLDNLGAYTVKEIKVYDQLAGIDRLIGEQVTSKKEHVMDVRLKRDYMDSWMGNATAGIGTHSRYLGRGFASRITPRSHVAAFVNANNVNEDRKPGEHVADWSPSTLPTGLLKTTTAGVDYSYELPDNKWKIDGDAILSHADADDGTATARTNYLTSGNTFDYNHASSWQKNLNLTTQHTFMRQGENSYLYLRPSLHYRRWDAIRTETFATFSQEQHEWSEAFLQSIYSGSIDLREVINSQLTSQSARGHNAGYDLSSSYTQVMKGRHNFFSLSTQLNGENNHEGLWRDYALLFPHAAEGSSHISQHHDNAPTRTLSASASGAFSHVPRKSSMIRLSYDFAYSHKTDASLLYALRESMGGQTLLQPSMTSLETLPYDASNSYRLTSTNATHTIKPYFSHQKGPWWIQASFPIFISTDHLWYSRGDYRAVKRRTNVLLDQSENTLIRYENQRVTYFFTATYTTKAPDLLHMIDVTDTTNPLQVTKGNDNLKQSSTLHINADAARKNARKRFFLALGIDYESTDNALSRGYSYDQTTGVRTIQTHNVDGNWKMSVYNHLDFAFGPQRMFFVRHSLSCRHQRSVDLLGDGRQSYLNKVDRNTLVEKLSVSANRWGHKLSAVANVEYSRFTAPTDEFVPFNALEFHYGLQGVFKLPCRLGLNTDLTVYSRRGYQDANLNSDSFVWNARLTYSMMKGRLLAMADGYDMLHSLKNVFYTVNAQGRTETYRTVLPKYFMLSLQWKFNTKNEKK